MIRDVRSGPQFFPIPDPESRGQKGTGSRIRNTAEDNNYFVEKVIFLKDDFYRFYSVSYVNFLERNRTRDATLHIERYLPSSYFSTR